ncbi:class I SAM-dependent methyltransferase [Jannaschia sp. LMIT008]|uniref:class I SAM-dependent methyltransferase n=1 Tax=Jannaschia maritima TaxID=3032585 RepID=UPI0028122FEF|nr:class I SAM-dependent methyltransferase [Jannaschia sp. LMIT008]
MTESAPLDAALTRSGIETVRRIGPGFDAALVVVDRSKARTLDRIARAVAAVPRGAPVVVDGDKGDGVESILKACRKAFPVSDAFSKAHGKTFAIHAEGPAPADWQAAPRQVDGFRTVPGVFSADGIDPGSAMLADALPPLAGRVCDLGAGWGYLAARILGASADVAALDLVESDHEALDCARVNVTDPRAAFHWADARDWDGGPYDAVVSNPPFHPARRADPELGRAFIRAAARGLAPKGTFWMVANRHLPYEAALADAFAQIDTVAQTGGYKVVAARRAKRP